MKWISVKDKGAEYPCLACDKFEQIWIPMAVVSIHHTSDNAKHYYDGEHFHFDVEEFFKGYDAGGGTRILPREIIAWMPLPKPFQQKEGT